ncbi:patatin-like phospholipase family protein [Haloechinothrix sp. LS1_15]|uniref:patatin-like phospholipase family protein n=1 Tax=Haloechinothrix sp. LS1_15 TaxID=2652248 RepID=UPI0029473E4A|nr:patatin-like phospholipase family protein [Haloechinothrix sp. LS1_15]MDV6013628.1 patatin-like phospholipase family protein [Haloechinothrix sp. LS1_15]
MAAATRDDSGPVTFVLSGGGTAGAVQVGMLQALYERGIAPETIVAASVGAINGAFIASRPPTVSAVEELAEVWRSLRSRDIFPVNPLTGLFGVFGWSSHLVSARGLRELIETWVEFDTLDQAPTPFSVIATDVLSGEEVRLSEGSTVSAILASAAIPGVFPPVRRDGRKLVDGGVTNNTPLSHAVRLGARRIYVLSAGYACALEEVPGSAMGVVLQSLSVLVQQRLVADIGQVPADVELTVLPLPCPLDVSPVDFSRAGELIERGKESARSFLADRVPSGDAAGNVMPHRHGGAAPHPV